jgi:hypothetical protein
MSEYSEEVVVFVYHLVLRLPELDMTLVQSLLYLSLDFKVSSMPYQFNLS